MVTVFMSIRRKLLICGFFVLSLSGELAFAFGKKPADPRDTDPGPVDGKRVIELLPVERLMIELPEGAFWDYGQNYQGKFITRFHGKRYLLTDDPWETEEGDTPDAPLAVRANSIYERFRVAGWLRQERVGVREMVTMPPLVSRLLSTLIVFSEHGPTFVSAKVRSIEEHYRLSYHVDGADIAAIAEAIHAKYQGPLGPKTLEHRYVLEDVPFGLVVIEALARCAGVDVPNVSGSITLLSSACGRDFRADNPLLANLAVDRSTPGQLLARCRAG